MPRAARGRHPLPPPRRGAAAAKRRGEPAAGGRASVLLPRTLARRPSRRRGEFGRGRAPAGRRPLLPCQPARRSRCGREESAPLPRAHAPLASRTRAARTRQPPPFAARALAAACWRPAPLGAECAAHGLPLGQARRLSRQPAAAGAALPLGAAAAGLRRAHGRRRLARRLPPLAAARQPAREDELPGAAAREPSARRGGAGSPRAQLDQAAPLLGPALLPQLRGRPRLPAPLPAAGLLPADAATGLSLPTRHPHGPTPASGDARHILPHRRSAPHPSTWRSTCAPSSPPARLRCASPPSRALRLRRAQSRRQSPRSPRLSTCPGTAARLRACATSSTPPAEEGRPRPRRASATSSA